MKTRRDLTDNRLYQLFISFTAGAGTRCMSLLSPPPYLFIFGLSFKNPTTKSSIKRCYRITAYPNAGS